MTILSRRALLAAIALGFAAYVTIVATGAESKPRSALTVAQIRKAEVVGDLGVPVGKVVNLRGKWQHKNPGRQRNGFSVLMLNATHVDGRKLENPVLIEIEAMASNRKANDINGIEDLFSNLGLKGLDGWDWTHPGTQRGTTDLPNPADGLEVEVRGAEFCEFRGMFNELEGELELATKSERRQRQYSDFRNYFVYYRVRVITPAAK